MKNHLGINGLQKCACHFRVFVYVTKERRCKKFISPNRTFLAHPLFHPTCESTSLTNTLPLSCARFSSSIFFFVFLHQSSLGSRYSPTDMTLGCRPSHHICRQMSLFVWQPNDDCELIIPQIQTSMQLSFVYIIHLIFKHMIASLNT